MFLKSDTTTDFVDKPSQCTREALVEQILWMIRLRWIAVGGMVAVTLLCTYVFPVLTTPLPIYICAVVLLGCNVVYLLAATKRAVDARPSDLVLGMIQQITNNMAGFIQIQHLVRVKLAKSFQMILVYMTW